jgi:hypothetical protein
MNRAWIPAGALAGVSVAGLLALGPLTDSLGTQVKFPSSAAPTQTAPAAPTAVPVSINLGQKGTTDTRPAALHSRGGVAADTSSAGQVSLKLRPARKAATSVSATVTSHTVTHTTVTPPAKPKKKAVKRPTIIGATGETNPTSGLAGAGSTKTSQGEQSSTPATAP